MKKYFNLYLLFLSFIISCGCEYYSRPQGYNRIILPEKNYMRLPDTFPYFFELSSHATVLPDSTSMAERYWLCIYYKIFDATIHVTYKKIDHDKKKFWDLTEDCRKLKNKHQVKAFSIMEKIYTNPANISSDIFELEGEIPSPIQFYASDTVNHFFRAALYFNIATKNDSLAPVIGFIKSDIYKMIETLRWKEF